MRKLTKNWCKILSKKISSYELYDMLQRASNEVTDWDSPSRCNKSMSRGKFWNMFCKDFDKEFLIAPILRYRMLEEFGEYLTDNMKQPAKEKREYKTHHEEPDFSNFK